VRYLTSTVNNKTTQILATMFAAYDKADNDKQLAAYAMMLKDIPVQVLMKACHKLMLESKFLPAISEVIQACRIITGEINPEARERTWAEAWEEIMEQVRICGTYDRPKWSTPEIAQAVKSYGYSDLCRLDRCDLQTASAQCRRFYEDACNRKHDKQINAFVLKNISGSELIGLLPGEEQKQIQVVK